MKKEFVPINEKIRADKVRLIDEKGEQKGIVSIGDALSMAREKKLDLVAVNIKEVPPICKIMDYNKQKYEKAKTRKKHHKVARLKEIRMSPTIGIHDVETKTRHIEEFLRAGHKVKVTVYFKGRQMAHTELGREVLNSVKEKFNEIAECEQDIRLEGYRMTILLFPKKGIK